MNTNISALQTLVEVWQNGDYITGVTPVIEQGETIGYVITFAKGDSITIYHGEDGADGKDGANGADGKDGVTPVIGVRQDSDNIYYWTLNGEWLTDEAGNKIKASGIDGKDGINGEDGKDGVNGEDGKDGADGADGKDGITPQLKIEDDYWWLSTDNGLTWTQLGKAKGEDGVNYCEVFKGVTEDDNYVYFTLADDSTIAVLKDKEFSLELNVEKFNYSLGYTYSFEYTITGATTATELEVIGSNNLQPTVDSYTLSDGVATGKITVEMPKAIVPHATVAVLASDGRSKVVMKAVHFYYEGYEDIDEGVLIITSGQALQFPKEGGDIAVGVQTNLSYRVEIPEEYSWLTVADTRAALREETLTFHAEPNEGNPRYAFAYLIDLADNSIKQTIYFGQVADNALMGEEVMFADETFKNYMIKSFDLNKDGILSKSEALEVKSVTVAKTVADLTGLEWCINLKSLTCSSNTQLTLLNTSSFAQLEELNINGSKIAAIDLSQNLRLKRLNVSSSQITELNFENNNELVTLYCNSISTLTNTTLVLDNQPYLEQLSCYSNKLTKLDISGCPALQELYCQSNSLTELDITNCCELLIFNCESNAIDELNFANTTKLRELKCSGNYLTELNLSACMSLDYNSYTIRLSNLREIDLGSVPGIKTLRLEINSDNKALDFYTLTVRGECLTSLNVFPSNEKVNSINLELPNLTEFHITSYMGDQIDFTGAPKIKSLTLTGNSLESLDLGYLTDLETLTITSATSLHKLNITENKLLKKLTIDEYGVALTNIDLTNNSELTKLTIRKASNLESLDLSKCLKLSSISLSSVSSLSHINFGENENYIDLDPFTSYSSGYGWSSPGSVLMNDLTIVAPRAKTLIVRDVHAAIKLNVEGCPNLTSLSVYNNSSSNSNGITEVDFTKLSELTTVNIACSNASDYPGTSFDFTQNKKLTSIKLSGKANVIKADNLTCLESFKIATANSVDIEGCTALETFEANVVRSLEFNNCPRLKSFTIDCDFESLNLSNLQLLEKVECNDSPTLAKLNVSGCTKLKELKCSGNPWLTSIDLGGCSALSTLNTYSCERLTSLGLNDCVALTQISCYECAITHLDVSHCPKLTSLDCSPMLGDGLEKVYVTSAQKISKVTENRNTSNIPAETEIVVVDAE